MCAFIFSLLVSVGVFYGEDYHVVTVFEAHPEGLFNMLLSVILMGAAPIFVSLGLQIAAFLKGDYARMGGLQSILIFIVGGFSAAWGYTYCAASYITYYDAILLARDSHIVGIDGYLLQIYSAYGITGAVWLVLAVFIIVTSMHSLLARAKWQSMIL